MADRKTVLVISAHAADFGWRAGGAVALCAARGYRVQPSPETIDVRGAEYRELQPEFILTHSFLDPWKPDHPTANLETRVYAQAPGYPLPGKKHLREYHTDPGQPRGTQAVCNGGPKEVKYAEAFPRLCPRVTFELS